MKIAVFGGAGYIGSVLCDKLRLLQHEVTSFDIGIHQQKLEITNKKIDICKIKPEDLEGYDAVYNLAGLSSEALCLSNRTVAWEVNVEAAGLLAKVCAEVGLKRYIFASTASVYDHYEHTAPIPEIRNADVHPISYYGQTKKAAERLVQQVQGQIGVVILRKGTVYGLSSTSRPRFDLAVQMMLRDALNGKLITVHGIERRWRPWIHIDDAVQAYINALHIPPGLYNCASENTTTEELALTIQAAMEGVLIRHLDGGDPRSYQIDSSKLLSHGWKPEFKTEDFILEYILNPLTSETMNNKIYYNTAYNPKP